MQHGGTWSGQSPVVGSQVAWHQGHSSKVHPMSPFSVGFLKAHYHGLQAPVLGGILRKLIPTPYTSINQSPLGLHTYLTKFVILASDFRSAKALKTSIASASLGRSANGKSICQVEFIQWTFVPLFPLCIHTNTPPVISAGIPCSQVRQGAWHQIGQKW